jgi:hypothetical protein
MIFVINFMVFCELSALIDPRFSADQAPQNYQKIPRTKKPPKNNPYQVSSISVHLLNPQTNKVELNFNLNKSFRE